MKKRTCVRACAVGALKGIALRTLGVCFVGFSAVLSSEHAHGSESMAEINVLHVNSTTLLVEFRDRFGEVLVLEFARDAAEDNWKVASNLHSEQVGIVFGDPSPVLPRAASMKERGLNAHDVLGTFSESIETRCLDDVVIYKLYDGDVVVGLIEDELVVRLEYAGEMVGELLSPEYDADPIVCWRAWNQCCFQGVTGSCVAVVSGCPAFKQGACSCLWEQCVIWDVPAACQAHIFHCSTMVMPAHAERVAELYGVVLELIQEIVDNSA